jgi:hypothetical protein
MSNTIGEISIRYRSAAELRMGKIFRYLSWEQEMIRPFAITNEQTPTGNVRGLGLGIRK